MKLSNSKLNKYMSCPKSFKYHYIDGIKPKYTKVSLLFGSALDTAFNELLIPTGKDVYEVFTNAFSTAEIAGVANTDIRTSPWVVYSKYDYDVSILTEDDLKHIPEGFENIRSKVNAIGFEYLTKDEKVVYNIAMWQISYRKGIMMLDAYKKEVLPHIKKVHEVQRNVELINDDGDAITGVIDLIADVDFNGVVETMLLDNKTSSIRYADDAVKTSTQLATYLYAIRGEYNITNAGFIVLRKGILNNSIKTCSKCGYVSGGKAKTCDNEINGARCKGEWNITNKHEVDIQIVTDTISEEYINLVMENYNDAGISIKSGVYPRNLTTCDKIYGAPCPYIAFCRTGSMYSLYKETKVIE